MIACDQTVIVVVDVSPLIALLQWLVPRNSAVMIVHNMNEKCSW